jgi:hypothetical protein
MTVGTDTYVTLTEADEYIQTNYLDTDEKYTDWFELSPKHQEVYLVKATKLIDRQPFVGYKALATQTLEFPRILWTEYRVDKSIRILSDRNWYEQKQVPQEVKDAQVEIAIELTQGESERVKMQRDGVKSFSLGRISETYTGSYNRFISGAAAELLAPFTTKSFRIGG